MHYQLPMNLNKQISSLLFLVFCACIAKGTTIKSSISETAVDSIGPWAFYQQTIDSIAPSGLIAADLLRTHDGSQWNNASYTAYTYNGFNKVQSQITYAYSGGQIMPSTKIERQFDPSGAMTMEIHYTYAGGAWTPTLRNWYTFSTFSNDSLKDVYNYVNGNWALRERYVKALGGRPATYSSLHLSWGSFGFDTLSFQVQHYNNNRIITDTLYAYQTPAFLPQFTRLSSYDVNNRLIQEKEQDLFSYYYIDLDTEYTYVEVDVEHTRQFMYSAQGKLSEIHRDLSFGSVQNRFFEHRYFTYDGNGELQSGFHHTGSNTNDNYLRIQYDSYTALQASFVVHPTTCTGCSNGSILITASNGIAPYTISISPQAGTLFNNEISGLAAGTYTVCVRDASGGSVCEELVVLDQPTGISSTALASGSVSIIQDLARKQIIVNNKLPDDLQLTLFNLQGQKISERMIHSGIDIFSSEYFTDGILLYTLSNGSAIFHGKAMLKQ